MKERSHTTDNIKVILLYYAMKIVLYVLYVKLSITVENKKCILSISLESLTIGRMERGKHLVDTFF